jgi:hypothetical protein
MYSGASRKPIIVFDTSGINKLTAEPDLCALTAGLTTAYSTRITGSNISELAATTKAQQRGRLFDTCQKLLISGDCVDPFWIVEKHVSAFEQNPTDYDWKKIDIGNRLFGEKIRERTMFDDNLANEEYQNATQTTEAFEDIFCSMRPAFDAVFANLTQRPSTFAEFVRRLQETDGAFWTGYGRKFYARNVATEPDEAKIREFAERCPPFLMMVLSAMMAQYKRAIIQNPKKRKRAGRIDLLMSIYLPYCRLFVTNDEDQEACLREMAAVAHLDREILSYSEFSSRLLCPTVLV